MERVWFCFAEYRPSCQQDCLTFFFCVVPKAQYPQNRGHRVDCSHLTDSGLHLAFLSRVRFSSPPAFCICIVCIVFFASRSKYGMLSVLRVRFRLCVAYCIGVCAMEQVFKTRATVFLKDLLIVNGRTYCYLFCCSSIVCVPRSSVPTL